MKILLVFDSLSTIENINPLSFKQGDIVYLFALTSQVNASAVFEQRLKDVGCEVRKLQTALMINAAAENLRDKYIRFIATLPGRILYKQKKLKEFFAIDEHASLWWLSLVSEKSPFKSNAFNSLAQLDFIIKSTSDNNIEKIVFWCKNKNLQDALSGYVPGRSIIFEALPERLSDKLNRQRTKK